MTFDRWVLFLFMETALSLSPGPAVFYVVSQGVRGWPRPLAATLGILSANAIYFALSATSVGALIATSPRFFIVAKWAGAAYLIYLGVMSLRAAMASHAASAAGGGSDDTQEIVETNMANAVSAVSAAGAAGGFGVRGAHEVRGAHDGGGAHDAGGRHDGQGGRLSIYGGALTLQLSNPKALLFFLALLPQFIDTRHGVGPQMVILAATSMLPEFCILIGYGWLAHRAARASARLGVTGTMNRWLGWIEGVGLLGCATLVLNFGR